MSRPFSSLVKRILCGAAAAIALAGAAEAFSRLVVDTPFFGLSPGLFMARAYGDSMGNARNAENTAFGVIVHSDEFGFRSPPPASFPRRKRRPS